MSIHQRSTSANRFTRIWDSLGEATQVRIVCYGAFIGYTVFSVTLVLLSHFFV